MEWFIGGLFLWAASLILIVYLRHRVTKGGANKVDFLEKHYEELDADEH